MSLKRTQPRKWVPVRTVFCRENQLSWRSYGNEYGKNMVRRKKKTARLYHIRLMSRRTRWIVGVILLGLLIYARQAGYVDAPQHQSDLERKVSGDVPVDDQRTQSDLGRYDRKSFTVVRVIDGDTLDIDIADSTGNWKTTRVRLWGVDTPETHHPNIKSPMFFWTRGGGIHPASCRRKNRYDSAGAATEKPRQIRATAGLCHAG